MPILRTFEATDSRLEVFSDITDTQLRLYPSCDQGLFIGESAKVIDRAIDAGTVPYAMFLEERWFKQSEPLIDRLLSLHPETPVFVASKELFRAVTGYQTTRGALAAFERPALPSVEELLRDARRVAIIEDITNYTNIGAIFRSAAALGIDAVLITPSCHDPLYRRAARVSMGTVFQVPWTRIGAKQEWAIEGLPLLRSCGFQTAALALSNDSISLDDPALKTINKLALVLGTEGDGLSQTTITSCEYTVKIPMAHEVDSLNVAAASAVAFWELRA